MNKTVPPDTDSIYIGNAVDFWDRGDERTVVGDYLGREPAVAMLAPKRHERILDAGCGTGYVTRMVHQAAGYNKGFIGGVPMLYGCDRSADMLGRAVMAEIRNPLGIVYVSGDVTDLAPYEDAFFDGIITTGVLIHLRRLQCERFFESAWRVLKPGGRLVIGIMDPALYEPDSPNCNGEATWAQYCATGISDGKTPWFLERYVDSNGRMFESHVLAHQIGYFLDALPAARFELARMQQVLVTSDVLRACRHEGSPTGYPAFCQFMAVKRLS